VENINSQNSDVKCILDISSDYSLHRCLQAAKYI
jgi:hypothetical protein